VYVKIKKKWSSLSNGVAYLFFFSLHVGYLPHSMTDDQLKAMFALVGPLTSAEIVRDKRTLMTRSIGKVVFDSEEDAEMAIERYSGEHKRNNMEDFINNILILRYFSYIQID